MTERCYVAYFDCLGFECILDATAHDRKKTWNALQNKTTARFPLNELIIRARLNSQRSPEIWSFWSEIELDTLKKYATEMPQQFAALIRENGNPLYQLEKQAQDIK